MGPLSQIEFENPQRRALIATWVGFLLLGLAVRLSKDMAGEKTETIGKGRNLGGYFLVIGNRVSELRTQLRACEL